MIYADNASTTKISDLAFEKMLPFLHDQYSNASSQHSFGIKARHAIENARVQAANAIGADPKEIAFTSGGSEANNQVISGIAKLYNGGHIVTTAIEHHSVLNACHAVEKMGIEVTYLPVNSRGIVQIESVFKALKLTTKLVSIMLANNETGAIQPISEIGISLRKRGILFHTDAVQALGHIPIDISDLNVDFLSASAHKFNGAKGVGFLYKRTGVSLPPLIYGGAQEHGDRAGTENTAGIVAMGYALEESIDNLDYEMAREHSLSKATIDGLRALIPGLIVNRYDAASLPGIINITLPNASGEALMHQLDLKGIYVSTSSACNAGSDEPSHVLIALGLSEKQAKSSIRISYGRYNTVEEKAIIVNAVASAYNKIIKSQA